MNIWRDMVPYFELKTLEKVKKKPLLYVSQDVMAIHR